MKPFSSKLAVAIAAFALTAVPAHAQSAPEGNSDLAAASLAGGDSARAMIRLEAELEKQPNDPALLINLGIAQAQAGQDANAMASFEAALASREVIELETANGKTTNSRRLARQAMAMLERGEFRAERRADRITMRDQ